MPISKLRADNIKATAVNPCLSGTRSGRALAVSGSENLAGLTVDGDLLGRLSKSLPTSSPVLEPESCGVAILRPVVLDQSQESSKTATEQSILIGGPVDEEEDGGDDGRDVMDCRGRPTERSPLLPPRDRHCPFSPKPTIRRAGETVNTDTDTNENNNENDAEPPPYLNGVSPGRFWFIFSQLLLSQFIGCFDGTIMASSHPVITSYFGAANSASWLSTAFLLTSTAFQPLLGRLSDAVGRKPLFLGCLAIFALATAWCAAAWSIESFIVARALCGLGAGGSMTLGSIITSDLVPIERRGAYQSMINVTFGVGSALGSALGGAMAEALGWRWEFGVQIPPLVLCLGISAVAIPAELGIVEEERKGVWRALREFDTRGSLLLSASISFLILGLNLGGNVLAWSHPFIVASLAVFAVCFPVFLLVESRVRRPIMPLHLIRYTPRSNLIIANFFAAMISNSIVFNIPLYFQAVLLTIATSSGLRLVLPSLVASIAGTGTGFAITWTRRLKWPLITGAAMYLAGTARLCLLRRDLKRAAYLLVLVPSSLGQGFQFPGTFLAVLACSAQADQAVVTSTLLLWRSLGMVLSVSASSLVVQNALVHHLGLNVYGPERESVIARVRASVEAIATLEEPYREQVIRSYDNALRLTFFCCIGLAVVNYLLLVPVKLPRLAFRKHGK
ncbi:Beta-aspartyl-peptidase [Purpureocillium takamizusanense]|uniref:Beta-aspartyl-peptidase n=1 Tax=Purpureocillium takamizusanense TaxID=2060973 RepID=A0A9Q8QN38_9HYPO|nr:Beta-aspartyl-peptidase [Purpureocillium takamizusanense]UNI21811.1 Beta-aspartyl-peptidase [Purpureocillium takamizusanense]